MSLPTPNRAAVLFADIVGSTRLYESLGDEKAKSIVAQAVDALKSILTEYEGQLIKTIGDEILATFPGANQACEAAISMQEHFQQNRFADTSLKLRIGFNEGPVMWENNDVFGNTVNLSARVVGLAKVGQILTTEFTLSQLHPLFASKTRLLGNFTLKGIQDEVIIHEILCEEQDEGVTVQFKDKNLSTSLKNEVSQIEIFFNSVKICINKDRRSVTIGRSPGNDLVVTTDTASRFHATLELKKGKCLLNDMSINGTFVRDEGGKIHHVHRSDFELKGKGTLSLGAPLDIAGTDHLIFYDCLA